MGVLSAGSVSTAACSSRYRRIASADHYVHLYPLPASGRADTGAEHSGRPHVGYLAVGRADAPVKLRVRRIDATFVEMGGMRHGLTGPIRRLTLGRKAAIEIEGITSYARPAGAIDFGAAYSRVTSYPPIEISSGDRGAARSCRVGVPAIRRRSATDVVRYAIQLRPGAAVFARGAGVAEMGVATFGD
jgi:hypothetical protein